jgi:hypothetical protein
MMASIYTIPGWFFGYDIALELLFAVITLFVAFYAWRIYRISSAREFGLMSVAFTFISLSFFAWSIINMSLVEELNETTRILVLNNITVLSVIGVYSHILLFMCGLITLFYMTTRGVNDKMYALTIILSVLGILFALNKTVAVYTFSSVILAFISFYYTKNYLENRNYATFAIMFSFGLLFLASLLMLFSSFPYSVYVIAHMCELIAFGTILFTLISILKNGGQKKKSPRNYP